MRPLPLEVSRKSGCLWPHFLHVTTRYHLNGSQSDKGMGEHWPRLCLDKRRASVTLIDHPVRFVYEIRASRQLTEFSSCLRIPAHRGHPFRLNVGSDSGTIV